ncbi:MAG TPA: VOC family protein [Pseudonocardiaceae bacterium]|nr:VOC family protein [Pseudonocardiaceae bacterium]
MAVHHVAVAVDDLDAAIDFYTTQLGMTVRRDRPDSAGPGAWLDAGGQQIHLTLVGPHFAVLVEDLDATTAQLRAGGVDVSDAVGIGADRQAFLTDPSGNAIELHELPRG